MEINYIPVKELEEALKVNPAEFLSLIHLKVATGQTLLETTDNDEYKEWNPTPVVDALLSEV